MNVLHLDQNHPILAQMLEQAGYTNHFDYSTPADQITSVIDQYDGIIIRSRIPIDATLLHAAKRLKFIGRVGAGLENIDLTTAQQLGIACFNAPEGNRTAVGEHATAMLLSLFNHLNRCDQQVRNGKWLRESNRGIELYGKTVGLIGYGNMGKSFARCLSGFNCKVLFYDLKSGIQDQYAQAVSLSDLMTQADVISLHTPQTTDTIGMINQSFIDACAKPFYLINTARGSAVVTRDLVHAIESGKILGAGLDVLEFEQSSFTSLFDHKMPAVLQQLLDSDRVLLSPHVAGWTIESKYKLAQVIASKIIKHNS